MAILSVCITHPASRTSSHLTLSPILSVLQWGTTLIHQPPMTGLKPSHQLTNQNLRNVQKLANKHGLITAWADQASRLGLGCSTSPSPTLLVWALLQDTPQLEVSFLGFAPTASPAGQFLHATTTSTPELCSSSCPTGQPSHYKETKTSVMPSEVNH